ncbi:MAG: hypothetical protein CVU95_16325 [Firmicutes bacterium HGW-Firmicutes-2]|jgi:hypothetical protein|nr:MAG: hypothetical protein CVU95_16325 [Firmicutes bacterium HGW-Firmicutes-2]
MSELPLLKNRFTADFTTGRIFKTLLLSLMVLVMTLNYWFGSDPGYQVDSEGLVVTLIDAGKFGLELPTRYFGLGTIETPETSDAYLFYNDPSLLDNGFTYYDYESQLGLQGWVFWFLAKFIPHPVAAFRLINSFLLSVVISLICLELNKKFGLLMSVCFYFVSLFSYWMTTFAPNLYWMAFSWFIPMLLGLVCLNNHAKRFWIYPLIFIAVAFKSAMGYEFVPVVMLGSIMFLVVEWLMVFNKDKVRRKILFKMIFSIGIICILAFAVAISIHAYIRGGGDILDGITVIYQHDISRRTFGNASDFTYNQALMDSLDASILAVLAKYLWVGKTGKLALVMLITSVFVIVFRLIKDRIFAAKDTWLLVVSFLTCIAWFVLGKSHSYIHTDINIIMWYMGFMQISFYVVLKFIFDKLSIVNFIKSNFARFERIGLS